MSNNISLSSTMNQKRLFKDVNPSNVCSKICHMFNYIKYGNDTQSDTSYNNDLQLLKELCSISNITNVRLSNTLRSVVNDNINLCNILSDIDELLKVCDGDKYDDCLLLLYTFVNISKNNDNVRSYYAKHNLYSDISTPYVVNGHNINTIHNINNSLKETDVYYGDCMNNIFTRHKINYELLMYEALFYVPTNILDNIDNITIEKLATKIQQLLNKLSPLLDGYIEDKYWIHNTKDTPNFRVGDVSNKIIYTNTIDNQYADSKDFLKRFTIVINYVRKYLTNHNVNYKIEEDSKYDIHWIFIIILPLEKDI